MEGRERQSNCLVSECGSMPRKAACWAGVLNPDLASSLASRVMNQIGKGLRKRVGEWGAIYREGHAGGGNRTRVDRRGPDGQE